MSSAGEGGLLGLAFHPDYAANGKVYLHLTNEAGDNEVFDTSTGRLYYDADGSSSGAS